MDVELRAGDREIAVHASGFGIEIEATQVDGALIFTTHITGPDGDRRPIGPFASLRIAHVEARQEHWSTMAQAGVTRSLMIRRLRWHVVRSSPSKPE